VLSGAVQADQNSPRTLLGGGAAPRTCGYQLPWDSASNPFKIVSGTTPNTVDIPVAPGFMDRAVILSIHLQQGGGNEKTPSFVGWLRVKTGANAPAAYQNYDYTWQFGA
jgi:hypothetical protein